MNGTTTWVKCAMRLTPPKIMTPSSATTTTPGDQLGAPDLPQRVR